MSQMQYKRVVVYLGTSRSSYVKFVRALSRFAGVSAARLMKDSLMRIAEENGLLAKLGAEEFDEAKLREFIRRSKQARPHAKSEADAGPHPEGG